MPPRRPIRAYNPAELPLALGSRLGVYEVTSQIGAGGMGQVYRATDTALGRQVAIKILPDTFASDPDRLARFEREARTLASLDHLHIATIYAVERSAGLHALVMELVEGEDLSQRIDRGAIPVDDALPIARQIAEALEAAHEQGIIHRDLKPANIKVRPDGMVKVLDFGLAKLTGPTGSQSSDVADSPTITSPAMTAQGMILGTAAYMAPEQARGKVIDKRVDVWAFGCILFEMLTGTRPFGGDNVTETLANVLKSAPDWKALPGDVPVIVRRLIQRCLEKDATRRLAATAAITYVLDEAVTAVDADPHAVTSVQATAAPARWYVATAALAVLFATVAAITVWRTRPPTEPLVVTRFPIASVEGPVTVGRNRIAVSRDGTRFVYYVNGRPLLRDTSQFAAKPIPSSFTGQTVFSPDGRTLAAWSADNTIKRVDIGGGTVETVCPVDNVFGMTWDTDALIVGQGPNGIVRCRLSGGAPQQIVKLEAGEEADGPQMLPSGGAVLFTLARTEDGAARWDNARIVIQSLTSNERSLVLERAHSGQYPGNWPFGVCPWRRRVRGPVRRAEKASHRTRYGGHRRCQAHAGVSHRRRAICHFQQWASVLHSRSGRDGNTRPQHRHRRSRGNGDAAPDSSRRIRAHACLSRRQVAGGGHRRRQGCGRSGPTPSEETVSCKSSPSKVITGTQSGHRTEPEWRSNPIAAAILGSSCNRRMEQAESND